MAEGKVPELPPGLKAAMESLAKIPKLDFKIPSIDLSAITKTHADAMAVFPQIHNQLAAQFAQIDAVQKQLAASWRFPSDQIAKQLSEAAKSFRIPELSLPQPTAEQIRIWDSIARTGRRTKALERAGILPHASTPVALLDNEASDDELRAVLERHYREKWDDVRREILRRAQLCELDDEAKASLAEALEAHQNGHFRSVCRLLLPEIERVTRVELLGNEVGTVRVDKVVGEPAMELPINETTPSGFYAMKLYERLTKHLYAKVGANNRGEFERDLVPNRHAAIHGLIVYNSFWHSLNTIFMTDFVFQVVSAIKQLGSDDS